MLVTLYQIIINVNEQYLMLHKSSWSPQTCLGGPKQSQKQLKCATWSYKIGSNSEMQKKTQKKSETNALQADQIRSWSDKQHGRFEP